MYSLLFLSHPVYLLTYLITHTDAQTQGHIASISRQHAQVRWKWRAADFGQAFNKAYTLLRRSAPCSIRLRWVLLMLQHQDHSINRPCTATDENKKKSSLFWLWSSICSQNGANLCPKCTKIRLVVGLCTDPLGEVMHFSRSLSRNKSGGGS